MKRSWVSGYLATRGHGAEIMAQWRIGYAPAGWTALTDHLRHCGRNDDAIQAAGLARRSSRGTLIDHFRDRVMLAIRTEDGTIAGFIGRARPDAGPKVPKYLNSPETVTFTKGDLLFGLHEARGQLAGGAVPVIVEGPFDAIADHRRRPNSIRGLGTQRNGADHPTGRSPQRRGRSGPESGVLIALDGDRAGREAAIKAHGVLLTVTRNATAVLLPTGRDPAEILQTDGPAALSSALQQAEPLAKVVIDAHIDRWAPQLDHVEGQLNAMRSAAFLIVSTLPSETADQIRQITNGRHLETLDEYLHHVANPELPVIARILPSDVICQILRVTQRLDTDHSEVTAAVANAVTGNTAAPGRLAARDHRYNPGRKQLASVEAAQASLSMASFPDLSRIVTGTAMNTAPERRVPISITRTQSAADKVNRRHRSPG